MIPKPSGDKFFEYVAFVTYPSICQNTLMCYINKNNFPQQMQYSEEKDDCDIIYGKLKRSLLFLSS